jgi:hypothetical protein
MRAGGFGGLTLARHRVVCTRALPPAVHARLDRFFDVSWGGLDGSYPQADGHTEIHTGSQTSSQTSSHGSVDIAPSADFSGVSALLIDESLCVDARLLARLPLLRAVCSVGPAHRHLDLGSLTQAGIIATNTPALDDEEAAGVAAENLIAAFGFGRLGGYPANLLNQDLACMGCCL